MKAKVYLHIAAIGLALMGASRSHLQGRVEAASTAASTAVGNVQAEGLPVAAPVASGAQPLFDFKESDIKFDLRSLMNLLRDARHEGWVLAAYPDPKTKKPLIGAGFSLDLEARDHPQLDPLNARTFLEPSSAQLWQAAGLDPKLLRSVLDGYERDLARWTARRYRRRIQTRSLTPQITDKEAMALLRISAIQAVSNARAYCREFDELTGPQQMAMSQLVFQMGVNLEEFTQFLAVINHEKNQEVNADVSQEMGVGVASSPTMLETDADHWMSVQRSLMQSQWATHYSSRAIAVIAMFDPAYGESPAQAERRVALALHPAVVHSRGGRSKPQLRTASLSRSGGHAQRKRVPATRRKRKLA